MLAAFTPVAAVAAEHAVFSPQRDVSRACAVYCVRHGNVRAHPGFMLGTFLDLVGAGFGALAPGRTLHVFFFS